MRQKHTGNTNLRSSSEHFRQVNDNIINFQSPATAINQKKSQVQSTKSSVIQMSSPMYDKILKSGSVINKKQFQAQEQSLAKILSNAPTYRIAHPSKNTAISISTKFWNETNQSNKALARQQQSQVNFGTPQNNFIIREVSRSQSQPRFMNEMLQQNEEGDEEQQQENHRYDEIFQQTAQNLNAKLSFQRVLGQHSQPYSFLSSVGGRQTAMEPFRAPKGYDLSQVLNQAQRINVLSHKETLDIYKKIDIDKDMIPQIMIQNKVKKTPQIVSTINKINIDDMMNEERIKEINRYEERLRQSQLQNQQLMPDMMNEGKKDRNKDRLIQTAAKRGGTPDINQGERQKKSFHKLDEINSKQLSAKSRQMTGKRESKKKSKKNKIILDELDKIDKDLGILDDFGEEMDNRSKMMQDRPQSQLLGKRPVSGLSIGTQQFFQNFQKFTNFNTVDIPYENLFDRNEPTFCATFAKFGDLTYYTPVQRIGNYMQYSAKLKVSHLENIIKLQQTISNDEKNEFEIPIQLSILDDLNPFQSRNRMGISTTFSARDLYREPLTLSLFPEYFEDQNENLTAIQAADKFFFQMLDEMGGVYDPEHLGKSNYIYIDPSVWPESIQKIVASSVVRYMHYLNSDIINADEIPKLKREWVVNALEKIEPELLKNESLYKMVFNEIFENFKYAMKKAMLDYILRSPLERARLNIDLIPRPVFCSAQRIAREGGFNIHLFNDWHKYVDTGREKSKQNLVLMNIINSALMNWFYDFQEFRLMEYQALRKISALGYSLSIQSFIKLQNIYKQNVVALMKYVWHRGALLTIKKFKYLRRPNIQSGKWTFCGLKKFDWKKKEVKTKVRIQTKTNFTKDKDLAQTPEFLKFLKQQHLNLKEQQKDVFIKNQTELQQIQQLSTEQLYTSMLQFLVENEFDDENHQVFDFFEDITFDQLLDIRQNPAYMNLAAKSHEDENTWKEENGWKQYTKEHKKKVLTNVGVLMGLQLRQIIENTMSQAEQFFLSFPILKSDLGIYIFNIDEDESEINFNIIKDTSAIHERSMVSQSKMDVSQNNLNIQKNSSGNKIGSAARKQLPIEEAEKKVNISNSKSGGKGVVEDDGKYSILKDALKELKTLEFRRPDFFNLIEGKFYPILNLEIIIQDDVLKFKETMEFLKIEMRNYLRQLMMAFSNMQHPKSVKIVVDKAYNPQSQLQFIKKMPKQKHAWMNIQEGDENCIDAFEDFYKRFSPFISTKEKFDKNDENLFNMVSNEQNKLMKQLQSKDDGQSDKNKLNINENLDQASAKKLLNIGNYQEKCFQSIENRIIQHLMKHYEQSAMTFQVFDQFAGFINKNAEKEMKVVIAKKFNLTNDEFRNYNEALIKFINLIHLIPDQVYMPLFNINCALVKEELRNHITDLRRKLEMTYQECLVSNLNNVLDQYNKISKFIQKPTNTADDVEIMERYVQALAIDKLKIKAQVQQCFSKVSFMMKLNIDLGDSITSLCKDVYEWPNRLDDDLILADEKHQLERLKLEERIREKRADFIITSKKLAEELTVFEEFSEYKLYNDYIVKIEEFEKVLALDNEVMMEITDQEKKMYGFASAFDVFNKVQKQFQPFSVLWKTVGNFIENRKRWLKGSIRDLDSAEVDQILKEQTKICNRLVGQFQPQPNVTNNTIVAFRITNKLREEVVELTKQLPVIDLISRPGIMDRHWALIFETIGLQQLQIKDMNLNRLLDNNLMSYTSKIELIVDNASKEFTLKNALVRMKREWETLQFVILNYKNRNIKILQGACIEDIQLILDDHVIKAQTIRNNPNIKFMEDEAIEWEKLVLYVQQVLEIWIKVQGQFVYLEPIFSFEDIFKTLATEASKFQIVQDTWNQIMDYVAADTKVLHIDKIPNLKKELEYCQKLIEEIQKGLEQHLESKRVQFPRFFFLSNDELITILAETRDPLLVQPHMKKCFEGISELIFNNSLDITGMKSSEKEEVNFLDKIQVSNYKSNVERWLLKVEEQMILSIAKVMDYSLADLKQNQKKHDWMRKWPGQVVLAINQLTWTEKVEEKLDIKNKQNNLTTIGIMSLYQTMNSQMEKIAAMVRGVLTVQETLTISALIVLEVHNKDIIKNMIDDKITDIQSFDWQSQMRFYWIEDSKRIKITMMTTSQDYGYEYLGNSSRLVITALTDRCYRTLMSAIQLNLGGAPEGPAGTGKTETTKDLAKALAYQCIVFNCSEGLNIFSMAKFFKGFISAGAWSCFDEFNKIDIEVLSVIAQQIGQIQETKASRNPTILFEGTELTIKFSVNIFVTQNPNYIGRSELPDNLKALFRAVAMMVPDFALIAEISLLSFGFINAKDLARKIVAVYKLSSEQLSNQDHYDYGMRAVKAVLNTASQLKRKFSSEKEDVLVLKSINDVNIPKFLSNDILLFQGIIQDLFPSVIVTASNYTSLSNSISTIFHQKRLQNVPSLTKKIFQLYEVINSRHGLMLIGQPFSGKTTCYQILAAAMSHAKREGDVNEFVSHYYIINPKSISVNKLYGYSDSVSKEWSEGILSEIYRKCAAVKLQEKQLIVFDGPVDAEWVENLNTVLDDNKKLCLMNGETISMTSFMTLIFEVSDLKQATPATVSRCGMIYMQDDQIGWRPILQSWLMKLSQKIDEDMSVHIDELFDAYVDVVQEFISSKCAEYQSIPEITRVVSLMRLFERMLDDYQMLDKNYVEKLKMDVILQRVDILFLYSIIWSLAGAVDNKGRQGFNRFFKTLIREPMKCVTKPDRVIKFDKIVIIPEGGYKVLIYDYIIEKTEYKWKKCIDLLQNNEESIPENTQYNSIVIQTVEMLRINDMINKSITADYPFLLMGPTGTGKSIYIKKFLKSLNISLFNIIFVNYSAQTSSEKTQEIIMNRMERRKKGIYGPQEGVKQLIFVDDLNLPAYDKYAAQPPIELLRQFVDQEGWYANDRTFMQIVDTQLICCMSPPGGGRNLITPRFLRHFNVIANIETSETELERIFLSIISWQMKMNDYPKTCVARFEGCVKASIYVFGLVSENLKPTPAKSHYQFNQRDLSRAVQGMTLINDSLLRNESEEMIDMKIMRIWLNEMKSVFFDRLILEQDQQKFYDDTLMVMRQHLKDDVRNVVKYNYDHYKLNLLKSDTLRVIRFGELAGEVENKNRYYDEISSLEKIYQKLDIFLEDFNTQSRKPMNLIFFEFAIDHIIKIGRILKLQQGHGMLIGLGGSGRQSLTMLASFIRDLPIYQIDVNKSYGIEQWMEDMQKIMIQAGTEHRELVFLISDDQIQKNFILEDINSMLNSGDIPQIFSMEVFSPFIDKMKSHAKKFGLKQLYESGSNSQLYDYFVECVKQKLHIVMALSCVGTSLRNRIRMYPNIINCTTIIWYFQWPDEALTTVATKNLHAIQIDGSLNRKITNIFKNMHTSSLKLSAYYEKLEGRIVYITPSSYLELQNNLQTLFHSERIKIEEKSTIYLNGVKQILITAEIVRKMEDELNDKKPVLIQMNEKTQLIADQIKSQAKSMEPKKLKVEQEEQEVNERVQEAETIKQSCEQDLSIAKPKLIKATKALDTLDPNDINNIKSMLKPPNTVKLVMEAICVICNIPPVAVPNPKNPKEKILDYWEATRKFLQDKNFLYYLKTFDKDNLDPDIMIKIRQNYISQTKDFNPARVEKASSAARGMCEWILALNEYEKVLQIVRPKQLKYNESKMKVEKLQLSLKQTREELEKLNLEIGGLENQFNELRQRQLLLQNDIFDCEQKLIRASTLIKSLGGEQQRWQTTAETLTNKLQYIVGDICLSAGVISYLGAFSLAYRIKIIKEWVINAQKNGITVSASFSLKETIGSPIDIRKWVLNFLPSDAFSIENAIITYNTKRWPLFIDPQGQAYKWIIISEQYDGSIVTVTKQTDPGFLRNLENAIQFGQSLVIENTKEKIDSTLDPVLSKQTFKLGGVLSIKIGESIIDYSKNFKLFFTSKLRNPHFTPEISTRVTILNFTITQEGLQDQLLEICISKEKPQDQELRSKLIVQRHENFKQLDQIEQNILDVLHNSASILDDESAITILQNSKNLAIEIEEKEKYSQETEERIDAQRENYKLIASHSAVLFFAVMDMGLQNMLYQYSLDWFTKLYIEAIDKAKKSEEVEDRVKFVNEYFTYSLYINVCRSLFEKDKLVFSFLLLAKILESRSLLNLDEFKFFISNVAAPEEDIIKQDEKKSLARILGKKKVVEVKKDKDTSSSLDNSKTLNKPQFGKQIATPEWFEKNSWLKMYTLQKLSPTFHGIIESLVESKDEWKALYFDPNVHTSPFPAPYDKISEIQRLCLLKIFRPEKVILAIQNFIKNELGDKFDNPPPFNINLSYIDSNPSIPLIFILPGSDPLSILQTFASSKNKYLKVISLGQGQGVLAEKAIEDGKLNGTWVLLQNCHLTPSWMVKFEKINEDIQNAYALQIGNKQSSVEAKDKINMGFRLWLTTYPIPQFPSSILQNSIKLTNEPPKGVKNNLLVSFTNEQLSEEKFFEGNKKASQFKTLLYGLCFFHAVLQERRAFGPLGWNIIYDFNQSDLRISCKQLFMMVGDYQQIPYKLLHYSVAECNYGGRVTDNLDRRILLALMDEYFSESIFVQDFCFAQCAQYKIPRSAGSHTDYINFINKLPSEQPPNIFGFNENGQIVKDMQQTQELCNSLLQLWTSTLNLSEYVEEDDQQSNKAESVLTTAINDIINKIPKPFDISIAEKKYEVSQYNSMNQVLHQELMKFNILSSLIIKSLKDVKSALVGDTVMSNALEELGGNITKGLVPKQWLKISYLSTKPLGSYINDFLKRLKYFQQWVDEAPPSIYWLGSFYFTQAFFTAALQNYARKNQIPIDAIQFDFQFFKEPNIFTLEQDGKSIPIQDGYLMHGLYFEGCRWNYETQMIDESLPKILNSIAPIIWLKPIDIASANKYQWYECPLYKTQIRQSFGSNQSEFINHVLNVQLPTDKTQTHWIKRGVAIICAIND